jgi:glyoxylase-like metal-dependent hydrolase (beta-lactamase superfamily II)
MTLEGTNSYVVAAQEGCYVIDPGPADPEHVAKLAAEAQAHGGIEGILLTHSHADHSLGVPLLEAQLLLGAVSAGEEGSAEAPPAEHPDEPFEIGPFRVVPTPGHAADHAVLMLDEICFCGDLVLGQGSSFVPPDGGSLGAYMESLHVLRDLEPTLLCPGHGPWVTAPRAKIDEYIEHRLDRERKLLAALESGERSKERLLDAAWDDVPGAMRPAAAIVMEAHLEKLAAEGVAPDDLLD